MNTTDWFKLSNYDRSKQWTAKEWYSAIYIRLLFKFWLAEFEKDGITPIQLESSTDEDPSLISREEFIARLSKKIIDLQRHPEGMSEDHFSNAEDISTKLITIVPIDLGYIGAVYNEIIAPMGDHVEQVLRGNENDNKLDGLASENIEERYLASGFSAEQMDNVATALIHLDMPDELLASQFIAFVRMRRAVLGIEARKKPTSIDDLNRWRAMRVLEYFDLSFWAKINQVTLTNEKIGTMLFSNQEHISLADKIRKSIQPKSEDVIRPATLRALEAQARAE